MNFMLNNVLVFFLRSFVEEYVVSQLLRQLPSLENSPTIRSVISHEYLKSTTRPGVYNDIIDLFTDVYFDAPNNELMSLMANVGTEIYNYVNDFNSLNIFGNNLLNRSSAAHGTDLIYLLGPTMYKNFFNSDFQSFSETRQ